MPERPPLHPLMPLPEKVSGWLDYLTERLIQIEYGISQAEGADTQYPLPGPARDLSILVQEIAAMQRDLLPLLYGH